MTIWAISRASRTWFADCLTARIRRFSNRPTWATPIARNGAAPGGTTPRRSATHHFKCTTIDLDRNAQYKIRIVYAGDSPNIKIRLVANDKIEIHPLITKPNPIAPIEFEIPKQATQSGELNLSWYREAALGGNGRGCQIAEVWLIKE